jgi:hypothetical protein
MTWKNWGDHPIVVTISVISGLCGIAPLGYTVYDHFGKQEVISIEKFTPSTPIQPIQNSPQKTPNQKTLVSPTPHFSPEISSAPVVSNPESRILPKPLDKPGLYLASTTLKYDDEDQLKADFRVYCPTSTIRPTNYFLVDGKGKLKKQGAWWEPAFTPKYDSEHELIKQVCNNK